MTSSANHVSWLQNINSASDKRFVIDAPSAVYVCRYGGKYLLRRIPPASYGSLNSCIITNKEEHMNKWKTTLA